MQGRLWFRASRTKGLSFQGGMLTTNMVSPPFASDRVGETAVVLPQLTYDSLF